MFGLIVYSCLLSNVIRLLIWLLWMWFGTTFQISFILWPEIQNHIIEYSPSNGLKVRDPLLRIHLPPWLSGLTPTMPWTPSERVTFDIVKDQGPNHKTTMMPQVKGLLCIIPTMSSRVTWVWELLFDCVQWTHSLLSTYMLVLVSVTPMTRDQSLSLREDIAHTDLNGLSMPNWQSYDQERLGCVYERMVS